MPLPIPQQVPPTGTAGHFATGPSTGTTNHSSIAIIGQSEWDQVPVKHRATHFATQIASINTHWDTMLNILDQACKDTESNIARLKANTALQRDNPSLHQDQLKALNQQLSSRKAAWQRMKSHVVETTKPNMLDLFYLNQTRQHLQTIAEVLQNPAISLNDKLPELVELTHGLGVCREGVALNIMECARQMHQKALPNKLHAVYKQSRNELIHQLLLRAVRTSHAGAQADSANQTDSKPGLLTAMRENKSLTIESIEIHDVQALKNALGETLGLDYVADRHISRKYEAEVGAIARQVIPGLITTHSVASLMAEKIHERTKQIIGSTNSNPEHTVDLTPLRTALNDEFGVGLDIAIDSVSLSPLPIDAIVQALLDSHTDMPRELQDATVTPGQLDLAMQAFVGKGKLTSDLRGVSSRQFFDSTYRAMLTAKLASGSPPGQTEDEKRKAKHRLELMEDSIHRATRHIST